MACRAVARGAEARLRPLGSGAAALLASRAKAGGAERDRTADLLIANEALSQLSYSPSAGVGHIWLRAGEVYLGFAFRQCQGEPASPCDLASLCPTRTAAFDPKRGSPPYARSAL